MCGAFLRELLRLIYLCLCVRAINVSNLMFLYQLQWSCEIKDVSEYELRREKDGTEFIFNSF